MKESTQLFQLIKSLTSQEKRYFKMNSEEGSIYSQLFDALDSEIEYNEKKFKIKFSKLNFIKNYSYNKIYLYNEILEKLSIKLSNKSEDAQIRNQLSRIEFLTGKGLLDQSKKLIEKLYKTAEDSEKHHYSLLILNQMSSLKTLITNPVEREDFMEKIAETEYEILTSMINQMDYFKLGTKIIKFMNMKGSVRTENDKKEVTDILNNKLLSDISLAKTIDSKCYFYLTNHLCYLALGNFNKAYKFSINGVNLIIDIDISKPSMRSRCRTMLGSHLLLLKYFPKKEKEFTETIHRYRQSIYPDRKKIPGRFIDSYNSEILFNIKKFRYLANSALLLELDKIIQNELTEYTKVTEYFFLASNAAYSEFICGNIENSLKWNNIALDEKDKIISYKAVTMVLILNLIIHFELGNYDLLEYKLISTYRYLIRKKRLFEYEKIIIHFIKNLVKNYTIKELNDNFQWVQKKLKSISEDENERAAFEDFDIISWLESKITNKPFMEVLINKKQ
ncbi:MAG: hypothetical protein IT280_09495 [Ignavibacteria bacterium]|nr:hypothetical protein [Ignavibacteria bacterium]